MDGQEVMNENYINKAAEALAGSLGEEYLKARGFSSETIRKYRFGYEPKAKAVIIPYPEKDYYIARPMYKGSGDNFKYMKPKGQAEPLFIAGDLKSRIAFYMEGQIDALSAVQAGASCAVAIGGAGAGKLMNEDLPERGIIIADNDTRGEEIAGKIRDLLKKKGIAVAIVHPPGGFKDCNDVLKADPEKLASLVKEWEGAELEPGEAVKAEAAGKAILFKSLSDVTEEQVNWLITGYLPAGEVVSLCGDGGTGKTSVWTTLAAAITTGKRSMFDEALNTPEQFVEGRKPGKVLFFSCEDSVPKVLVGRLRKAGADISRIVFYDADNTDAAGIYFDSPELEGVISDYRPSLVVFDPIQSFIPPGVTMAARNEMRKCIGNLTRLGHKYTSTFLLIVHTNKKVNVSGRARISDSSDIWDISRSVLIVGNTQEEGVRYLSQEKNSYDKLAPTIIFTVSDNGLSFKEITTKRDRDFVQENSQPARGAFALDEAKDLILVALKDGETATADLDKAMFDNGITLSTLKRAKKALHESGKISYRGEGYGSSKRFFVRLTDSIS